ncbi:MAG: alpha/beta fold hydrolase [Chitinophagales bacterium]
MQLNFLKSGRGSPLIILHGLYGMLDNWKSIAKVLEESFTVYLIDQRNHGKSPHTNEHSYKLMSKDLLEFFGQQNIASAHIIGHSMGAKTAMQFTLDHSKMVEKLIVVDMGVKRYSGGHDAIFDALFSIDLNEIHYRADAEKILLDKISDFGTRQFILKNLSRNINGSYQWKFNLQALFKNYESEILAPIQANHSFKKPTLFIRGGDSEYIQDGDWEKIQTLFPNSRLETIEGAGHWVHVDKPVILLKHIKEFF